ncbi:MAG TPA: sugar ABC transporter permease [Thermomicrobiales bacterium]|nr:sugar ABC transporter permease [Thermomicrobiales bacterium]
MATVSHAHRGSRQLQRNQLHFAIFVFVPIMALFIIIRIIPIIQMLATSPTNRSLRRPFTRWIGFENFTRMWDDPAFVNALTNSIKFVAVALPAEIILGLIFATLMSRVVRFESLYQTLFFVPYVLPMVPAAIVWKWIYAPGIYGLANMALNEVGIAPVGWLTNTQLALFLIIGVHVWKNLGFYVVVFLVGIKAIPPDLREAAALDGASPIRIAFGIDLPLLKPIILFSAVMSAIMAWSSFTEVYVMTQGSDISAGTDLKVLVTKIYEEGFQYGAVGYASAISLVLFGISIVIVAVLFGLFRERS